MLKLRPSRWVNLIVVVVLSGCAYAPPIQEMSDARQSARAALDAGADRYFPTIMERVDAGLAQAEQELELTDYQSAEQKALAAKNDAVRARTLVLALTSTLDVVAQAEHIATLNPNTRTILRQAIEAASRGEEAVAMVLVEQARQEAESVLATELRHPCEAAETAIRNREGPRAYGLLAPYSSH